MKTITTPIKSQGKKTKQAEIIAKYITELNNEVTYIEPFLGSGAVAFNLKPQKAILADTNPFIIQFYKDVQSHIITPESARVYLEEQGILLEQTNGSYYYTVRDRFNRQPTSLDFLFLNRACYNGLMRFNQSKQYKNPKRFSKAYISKICNQIKQVQDLLDKRPDWQFVCQDFRTTLAMATESSVIYLDPPYNDRNNTYYTSWTTTDQKDLENTIQSLECPWVLSAWYTTKNRTNTHLLNVFKDYSFVTYPVIFHIGPHEENRPTVIECIIFQKSTLIS